jgi:hypothetical protein
MLKARYSDKHVANHPAKAIRRSREGDENEDKDKVSLLVAEDDCR